VSWSGSIVPDSRSEGGGSRPADGPFPSTRRVDPQLPHGQFEVLGELGRGGMGAVYRAKERHTGREVALKVILSPRSNPRRLARFRREAEWAASLKHPGLVAVHSADLDADPPWIAYELIPEARTLADGLRAAPLRVRVGWILEVARAVGAAHSEGIIHRDLKPQNVLLDGMGCARVTDFGLAAHEDAERLTRSGALVGTPHYMAPEQIGSDRENHGPHTDVWALGVMLYEAIVGERPFPGPTVLALGAQITSERVPRPSERADGVPLSWDHVVLKALSRPIPQRYPDANAFAADLERALQGVRLGRAQRLLRRVAVASAVLAVVALLGAAVSLVGRSGGDADEGALSLELASLPDQTARDSLLVRGTAPAEVSEVQLELNGQVERVPLVGGRLQREVPLKLGTNTIRLVVPGGDAHTALVVRVPFWWSRLSERECPPLPLPEGLEFGDETGEYVNTPDGSRLVWIPPAREALFGGRGGDDGATNFYRDEFRRSLPGFFLGKYEVTWRQMDAYFKATGQQVDLVRRRTFVKVGTSIDDSSRKLDRPILGGDDEPALRLRLSEILGYLEWARLRLPDEDEWEFAARGDEGQPFPYGDRVDPKRINSQNVADLAPGEPGDRYLTTAPVHSMEEGRGPFGCFHQAGNVMELTVSRSATASSNHVQTILEGYVGRGGSWVAQPAYCNTYIRWPIEDQGPEKDLRQELGFRVARDAD